MTNKSKAANPTEQADAGEGATFNPMRLPAAFAALGVAVAALVKFPSRPVPQTLVHRVDEAVAEINLAVAEQADMFGSLTELKSVEIDFDFSEQVQTAIDKLLPDAVDAAAKEAVERAAADVDKRIEARIGEAQAALDAQRSPPAGDGKKKGETASPGEGKGADAAPDAAKSLV